MSEDKLSLRIELQGEHRKLFEKIKKEYMFQNNTDVIRFCINEAAQGSSVDLDNDFIQVIQSYLLNDNVKHKYSIFSVDDFVKKAIEYLIQDIKQNLESIKSWDIRSNLSEEEAEIALAIIECQSENDANQIVVDDLVQKLNRRNSKKIEHTLDDFVNRGILSSKILKGKKYYHA